MVVRLEGSVNGENVIFQRVYGDVWETSVLSSLDGTYVIDMTAHDEAGNEAYWAKYILTIDLTSLCAHLAKHPYQAEILPADYSAAICDGDYGIEIVQELTADVTLGNYYAELMKGRCDWNDVCKF